MPVMSKEYMRAYHESRPLYHTWQQMKKRCSNPNVDGYENYGGRGITVCESWAASFESFARDMGERPEGMTLDRIDTDGPYSPENCRWATHTTQGRNRRNNRLLTMDGRTMSMIEWSEETGIPKRTLQSRLNIHGWSVRDALTTPVRTYTRKAA